MSPIDVLSHFDNPKYKEDILMRKKNTSNRTYIKVTTHFQNGKTVKSSIDGQFEG